eukprot:gene16378-21597_t
MLAGLPALFPALSRALLLAAGGASPPAAAGGPTLLLGWDPARAEDATDATD